MQIHTPLMFISVDISKPFICHDEQDILKDKTTLLYDNEYVMMLGLLWILLLWYIGQYS